MVPDSALKSVLCSPTVDVEPIDAISATVRPLKKDDASPSEAERDLNNET